jgi:ATP-dependent Clp protease ATP-binding subunit ClpC
MDLLVYLLYFTFVGFPLKLLTLLYRIIVRLIQEIGFIAIFKSFFKPLFGFSGIINRISGMYARTMLFFIGLALFIISVAACLAVLLIVFALPFILLYEGQYIEAVLIYAVFVLWKVYDYYYKPLHKIKDYQDIQEYYTAGNIDLRLALRSFTFNDFQTGLNSLKNKAEIKTYLSYLELPYQETMDFILKGAATFKREDYLSTLIKVNSQVKQNTLSYELLFGTLMAMTPNIDHFLAKYSLVESFIPNSLIYVYHLKKTEPKIWHEDYKIPPAAGIDKGWAVTPTFTLNKHGEDFTKQALKGYMPKLIGREDLKEQIINTLSKKSKKNVILLGHAGTGKSTIVKGLAREIALGTNIAALRFKRIMSLNIPEVISGGPAETAKKMGIIMKEIESSGNIILFIDEMHTMFTLSQDSQILLSIFDKALNNSKMQIIGATTRNNYNDLITKNESFTNSFDIVEIRETTKEETIQIMAETIKTSGRRKMVTYPAIDSAYELSKKYIYDRYFPDKAVQLLTGAIAASTTELIAKESIAVSLSNRLKIPVSSLQADDKDKLINLEGTLKARVIGQDLAVKYVADALKRGRMGIRNESKPIASFLFYGPTGVGKTETAKAIADIYFGSPDFMIRIDMSEFQNRESIYRLIGGPGYPTGLLTSQIKARPYALVLLDEIEKADKNVFNLFLQVLDDGRLTDSSGNFISFANTLIVMTSNAGTGDIITAINQDLSKEEVVKKGIDALKTVYAPEFLNRFTALVPFSPLTPEQIELVARIKLKDVQNKLLKQQIVIQFSDEVIKEIAQKGYSREWGVRPLNRAIEEFIETKIANLLLEGTIKPGDTYTMETL